MIAIVTGATGGLGQEFIKQIKDDVEQVWAVGRSAEKLAALKQTFGEKIEPVQVDLSDTDELLAFCRKIEKEKPTFPRRRSAPCWT